MQTDTTRENPQGSVTQAADSNLDLSATAPGQLRVIKRNGTVVPYTDDKITVAITKAFLAVEGGTAAASSRIHDTVARLTEQVTATFKRRMPSGGTIHIEEIQDQVELALMRAGEQKVARDYVIYRDARSKERAVRTPAEEAAVQAHPSIRITLADGTFAPLDLGRLNTIITEACEGLEEVDGDLIQRETLKNLYDGVALTDVNTALVMTARTLVEREPNYSFVTARLLMDTLRAEGLSFLEVAESATHHEMVDLYAKALPSYIAKGIQFELLNPVLAEFDLEKLGKAINHERDQQFTYLGLQTLYDHILGLALLVLTSLVAGIEVGLALLLGGRRRLDGLGLTLSGIRRVARVAGVLRILRVVLAAPAAVRGRRRVLEGLPLLPRGRLLLDVAFVGLGVVRAVVPHPDLVGLAVERLGLEVRRDREVLVVHGVRGCAVGGHVRPERKWCRKICVSHLDCGPRLGR